MTFKEKIREAVANYMQSEGCGCCTGSEHSKNEIILAELLDVPQYKDTSGYDFSKFHPFVSVAFDGYDFFFHITQ